MQAFTANRHASIKRDVQHNDSPLSVEQTVRGGLADARCRSSDDGESVHILHSISAFVMIISARRSGRSLVLRYPRTVAALTRSHIPVRQSTDPIAAGRPWRPFMIPPVLLLPHPSLCARRATLRSFPMTRLPTTRNPPAD